MPKIPAPFPFLLLAAALAGGCGGPPSARTQTDGIPLPPDTMVCATDELGTRGGRFVIAQTSAPKSFNPLMANETSSTDITDRMFVGLAEFDNRLQIDTPMLAKRWEVSPDGLTWTFHLRRGARFSDGHLLTSADVRFTFEVANDSILHPSAGDLLRVDGRPVEISAPDSYTVVVRAPRPHAVLLSALSSVRILPRHRLEQAYREGRFASAYGTDTPPESLVTSGPWRLGRHLSGERTVLERNPYWFGVDERGQRLPYLDQLVFLQVPDQNTAAYQFKSGRGEVDALDNVRPEDYQTYLDGQASGNYRLHDVGPSLNSAFLLFNLNRVREPQRGRRAGEPWVGAAKYAWFGDPRFRRAVSMAIDRDAIIRSVLFGHGVKNWQLMTPGCVAWHDTTVTGADYDPEGARRLLTAIGMRDRDGNGVLEDAAGREVAFTLKTNSDSDLRVRMMNFVKDDLARVGIRCTPLPVEMRSLVSNVREDFQYDAILLGLSSGVPPDPGMAANVFLSRGSTHFWNMRQPRPATAAEAEIDRLFEEGLTTLDPAARRRSYVAMARIWNEQVFTIWLPTQIVRLPVRNGFGNVHPTVIPHRILWNIDRVFAKKQEPRA